MARRCKMAKEFNWPKRVVLQRFHDDFLRQFEDSRFSSSVPRFYTDLARPTVICCNADFISSPLLRKASKMKAKVHVWAEPDSSCTMYIEDYHT